MQMAAYQPELSPELAVIIGNVDYHQYRITLERIDHLLWAHNSLVLKGISGVDDSPFKVWNHRD